MRIAGMHRSMVLLLTTLLASCAGLDAGGPQEVYADTLARAEATAHGAVEYRGREKFQYMPADQPALEAVRVGTARDESLHMYLGIAAAGIERGQVVADIGCGKGRYSIDFAQAAGETGFLYCRDTSDYKIEAIRQRVEEEGITNIDFAVSPKHDVQLPPESIDVAVLIDVYVYVLKQEETKDAFLDSIYASMKPGGVVVVVHVKSSHLWEADRRQAVYRQTLEDFVAHGFVPGRRLVFSQESRPAKVLEFKKPE